MLLWGALIVALLLAAMALPWALGVLHHRPLAGARQLACLPGQRALT
jgi:hypothetical protein